MNSLRRLRKRENRPVWNEQEQCLFLQLPGELRNIIYSLVFARSDDPSDKDYYADLKTVQRPSLTAVCSQIKHESLPIFFHNTRFFLTITIDTNWHLQKPLISHSTSAWIKNVEGQIRQLRCIIIGPPTASVLAFDLIPRSNPHFGTSWSICLKRDHSDFPHCANIFMAHKWTSLARSGKTGTLKMDDVQGLVDCAVGVWAPAIHRWFMRHPRLRRQIHNMIPKWMFHDYVERACECEKCWKRQCKEKKAAKKTANAA